MVNTVGKKEANGTNSEKTAEAKQKIIITDKSRIEIGGVRAILEFDERFLRLDTVLGVLIIEGEEMRLEDMSHESGRVLVLGELCQLAFAGQRKRRKSSFTK